MNKQEALEVLEPSTKKLTFEEGFKIYKKFLNQPIECGTSINVEGFNPISVNGFRVEKTDEYGNLVEITEDDLKELFNNALNGDEGEPL